METLNKIAYLMTIVLCVLILFTIPFTWIKAYAILVLIILGFDINERRRYDGNNRTRNNEIVEDGEKERDGKTD